MATSSDQLSPPESPPVQFSECLVDVRSISRKGALREDDNEHEKPAQLLDEVPVERRVPVVWSGLNAHVPIFEARPSFGQRVKRSIPCWPSGSRSSARKQQVLYDVKGACYPGEVMALMGPSGSGKTTLLSIIGGRAPRAMTTTGKVLFGGRVLSRHVKRSVGYVMQDDLLFDSLTVEETLLYAARLRLPRHVSLADKQKRVDAVIAALGLNKCRRTLIGGAARRGVSGGERKRVSVGHELLIDPAVLILDEPTSGLDSTTAMHLLSALRNLASGGRTIVTSIHQPSSRLFQQLDRVLLLSDGHVMYSGAQAQVTPWFAHLGCQLPYGINAADFILDLASGQFEEERVLGGEGDEREHRLIEACEGFLQRCEDGFRGPEDFHHVPGNSALKAVHAEPSEPRQLDMAEKAEEAKRHKRVGASYLEQLRVLFVRSGRTRRFDTLGLQRLIQFVAAGLVAGLLWWQRGQERTLLGATDAAALLFFELIYLSFSMMFAAIFTFPSEMAMLLKERSSDMYRLSAYYLARSTATLPLDLLYPLIFVSLAYWMGGLRVAADAFICNALTVMLGLLNAQSLGLAIGAIMPGYQQAQTTATVLMLTFMLCSGFWIQEVPGFLQWIRYLSWIYWTYSLQLKIQFRDATYYNCRLLDGIEENDIAVQSQCAPVRNVSADINTPRDVEDSPWLDIVVLFIMLIVLRVLVYLVLLYKTRRA